MNEMSATAHRFNTPNPDTKDPTYSGLYLQVLRSWRAICICAYGSFGARWFGHLVGSTKDRSRKKISEGKNQPHWAEYRCEWFGSIKGTSGMPEQPTEELQRL